MRRNLAVLIVVAAAVAIMLLAVNYVSKHRPDGLSGLNVAGGPKPGTPAPDFELESLDGATVHLSDFRGKAVLLNFWATWCQPCKIEMPWFSELANRYGPEGLQVIGIAMDDAGKDEIAKFVKEMGVTYPVLLGKEKVGDDYGGVQYLPTTFYIDREGKVVNRVFGLRSRSDIEDYVKQALKQPHVAKK